MRVGNSSAEKELVRAHNLRDIYLTPAGQTLLATNPNAIPNFIRSTHNIDLMLTGRGSKATRDNSPEVFIDRGDFSFVYTYPKDDTLCIKTVVPERDQLTRRRNVHTTIRKGGAPANLMTEARIMYALGEAINSKARHSKVPTYYGAIKLPSGTEGLLMERAPLDYKDGVSLVVFSDNKKDIPYYRSRVKKVFKEVDEIVPPVLLQCLPGRFDVHGEPHLGNILLPKRGEQGNRPAYIVDLIGYKPLQKFFANAVGLFVPQQPNVTKSNPNKPALAR